MAVVDIAARRVVATVPTGSGPNGISFPPSAPAAPAAPEIAMAVPDHEDDEMSRMDH